MFDHDEDFLAYELPDLVESEEVARAECNMYMDCETCPYAESCILRDEGFY